MEILVAGVSHRTAALELRERLAFSAEATASALERLRAGGRFREAVILSTCNRSEVYARAAAGGDAADRLRRFFGEFDGIGAEALQEALYCHVDAAAVRHLFRVSAGLDSLLLGEAEILGQVRQAYKRARALGATGALLNRLFQDALAVGKRVRAETEISVRPTSVALAAVRLAEKVFAGLKGRAVLILGAGAMAEQTAECLASLGAGRMRVANRTAARGRELARRFGAEPITWEAMEAALGECDIVISSTSATEPVLGAAEVGRAMAARRNRPLFFIDIAVPRNIDARVGALYNVYLYNLDDFKQIVEQNKKEREKEIPRAERLVDEQVKKFLGWQQRRAAYGRKDAP